jgi:hypothetical protein
MPLNRILKRKRQRPRRVECRWPSRRRSCQRWRRQARCKQAKASPQGCCICQRPKQPRKAAVSANDRTSPARLLYLPTTEPESSRWRVTLLRKKRQWQIALPYLGQHREPPLIWRGLAIVEHQAPPAPQTGFHPPLPTMSRFTASRPGASTQPSPI